MDSSHTASVTDLEEALSKYNMNMEDLGGLKGQVTEEEQKSEYLLNEEKRNAQQGMYAVQRSAQAKAQVLEDQLKAGEADDFDPLSGMKVTLRRQAETYYKEIMDQNKAAEEDYFHLTSLENELLGTKELIQIMKVREFTEDKILNGEMENVLVACQSIFANANQVLQDIYERLGDAKMALADIMEERLNMGDDVRDVLHSRLMDVIDEGDKFNNEKTLEIDTNWQGVIDAEDQDMSNTENARGSYYTKFGQDALHQFSKEENTRAAIDAAVDAAIAEEASDKTEQRAKSLEFKQGEREFDLLLRNAEEKGV